MRLSHRAAREADFAACFDLMCEAQAYAPELRRRAPALWAGWLREGVMMAHAVDEHGPRGARTVGLGACVCVREAFIEEALGAGGRPWLRAELTRRALRGEAVVLNREEMRAANRDGGLTLFFLNDAVSHRGLSDEECLLADAKWGEALNELRGCRLKSMWIEVYGRKKQGWAEGCGLRLARDWGEEGPWDEASRPFLMGLRREEALAARGSHASFLFMHTPPQFGFSARQQEMLARALEGATDEELAGALHVSVSAVKKRWVAIYDQVGAAMPGWLERDAGAGELRGGERRRHLLNHLRQRPEELHPACAARE